MHPAACFASVLEAKLQPARQSAMPGIATTAWMGAVIDTGGPRHAWTTVAAELGEVRQAKRPDGPAVKLLLLAPEARTAMATLRAAGAVLPDRCTSGDLRRAFRQLARRYHPDRHPQGSRADHQRLAAVFSDVRAAYATVRRELARRGM